MQFDFFIPIEPVAKARPRLGKGGNVYTPGNTRVFEQFVRQFASYRENVKPLKRKVPVFVELEFHLPIPASRRREFELSGGTMEPTVRPDLDNYAKSILDALNGVAWEDDAQVVQMNCSKLYAPQPGVRICIQALHAHKFVPLPDSNPMEAA